MKACVTGANGFVGSKLCEALAARGDATTGMVRTTSDLQFLTPIPRVTVRHGDLTDRDSLLAAFRDVDVVFHVAALASDWGAWGVFRQVNVEGVRNVMECALASGVRRVVHVSSVSVYGFPGRTSLPEDAGFISRPEDPYITTKQEGERIALRYLDRGLEVVVVRPAGIYGPNDRTTSLRLFPELEKRALPYVDGGRHVMAPLYIDNLIQAMLLAATAPRASGEAYNVMDDGRITWRTYFQWVCDELGCRRPALSAPTWLAWPLASIVERMAKVTRMHDAPLTRYRIRAVMADAHYSTLKAKEQLGYRPPVATREGIRRTVAWYREFQAGSEKKGKASHAYVLRHRRRRLPRRTAGPTARVSG